MPVVRVPPAETESGAFGGICAGIILTIIGVLIIAFSWSWGIWFLVLGVSVIIWGIGSYSNVSSKKKFSSSRNRSAPYSGSIYYPNASDFYRNTMPQNRYYARPTPAPYPPAPAINILRPDWVDVNMDGDYVIVTLGLPRANKDSIEVKIVGRLLTVIADVAGCLDVYHHKILLPEEVYNESAKGRFQNGLLELKLTKKVCGTLQGEGHEQDIIR